MAGNKILKTDIDDNDFVDAIELASDGYYVYRIGNLTSTTASTKTVIINQLSFLDRLDLVDEPLQHLDRVYILNNNIDGYFTVNQVLSSTNFSVLESIPDSTDGLIHYIHPAGALHVGIDNTNLSFTDAINVQKALEDLDGYLIPRPTEYGQILYAVDSSNLVFLATKPIINDEGLILVNEDDVIVVL